ncbi:MAG: hypothetical protein GY851_01345, partial [bacterium]|nr:hypothetical protein [bacterium]
MIVAILGCSLIGAVELPVGSAPVPVTVPHFPDQLHAFVWRNWQLVPADQMAETVGASKDQILAVGKSMGLEKQPAITADHQGRSYITVIRRNWHLLPYDQLLTLLDWTAEEMDYALREDDFLYIKLGRLKPKCAPLEYAEPDAATKARAAVIGQSMAEAFPAGVLHAEEPLFDFVRQLSEPPEPTDAPVRESMFSPRYCYSYFALYGDPLLDPEADPFPDGYLARLARSGVNGVWLQAVLYKLAPFPWDESLSAQYEERLANLGALVARARKHGVGIYLYLNEPRSMPTAFFEDCPEVMGVTEGAYGAMCSSTDEVKDYIRGSVSTICKAVPDLAGFFTITASENFTNCWSHGQGANCPRCKELGPAAVIAGVNATIDEGIQQAGTGAELIAWDWGWRDDWAEEAVNLLPKTVSYMSVSEWSIPFERGGIKATVGEYSISVIGPGPRATRN